MNDTIFQEFFGVNEFDEIIILMIDGKLLAQRSPKGQFRSSQINKPQQMNLIAVGHFLV